MLRELDLRSLMRSNFGMNQSGPHAMVSLGKGEWIQADPVSSKFIIQMPTENPSPSFDRIVSIQRWSVPE